MKEKILMIVLILCFVLCFVNFMVVLSLHSIKEEIQEYIKGIDSYRTGKEYQKVVETQKGDILLEEFTIFEGQSFGDSVTFKDEWEKIVPLNPLKPAEFRKTTEWLGIDERDIPYLQEKVRKVYRATSREQKKRLVKEFSRDLKEMLKKVSDRKIEALLGIVEQKLKKTLQEQEKEEKEVPN